MTLLHNLLGDILGEYCYIQATDEFANASFELAKSFPDMQPLYDAARSYLEIPQRVDLLNARVEVLQDLLGLLKESVSSRHAERLEQIVIALIGVEISKSYTSRSIRTIGTDRVPQF